MNNIWYLSPSNQSGNVGINGYGTEQEQMYRLTDAITPHLDRCGVSYYVADHYLTLAERCAESNAMKATYHLALHSNAGGGNAYGPIAFYYNAGKRLAERLIQALLTAGQQNNRSSNLQQNTSLYELRSTIAAACLLEVDFHDSAIGVDFLTNRRSDIAKAIAQTIVAMDGKQWVEESTTSQTAKTKAAEYQLFQPNADSNYRWSDYLTREEAAYALIRLKEIIDKQT